MSKISSQNELALKKQPSSRLYQLQKIIEMTIQNSHLALLTKEGMKSFSEIQIPLEGDSSSGYPKVEMNKREKDKWKYRFLFQLCWLTLMLYGLKRALIIFQSL